MEQCIAHLSKILSGILMGLDSAINVTNKLAGFAVVIYPKYSGEAIFYIITY